MSIISSLTSPIQTALAGGSTLADCADTAKAALAANLAAAEAAKSWPTITGLSSGDFTTLYGLVSDGGGGTDQRAAFAAVIAALKVGSGNQQNQALAIWQLIKVSANAYPDLVAAAGGW